jgi:hypothetical protein
VRDFRSEREERVQAYLEQADSFMKLAEQTRAEDRREALLQVATEWLKLAAEVDKSSTDWQ